MNAPIIFKHSLAPWKKRNIITNNDAVQTWNTEINNNWQNDGHKGKCNRNRIDVVLFPNLLKRPNRPYMKVFDSHQSIQQVLNGWQIKYCLCPTSQKSRSFIHLNNSRNLWNSLLKLITCLIRNLFNTTRVNMAQCIYSAKSCVPFFRTASEENNY